MEKQLLLFDNDNADYDELWEAHEGLKISHHKVRKKLFAEVGELKKRLEQSQEEIEKLKFRTESVTGFCTKSPSYSTPVFRWVDNV
jgi:hypothetical protein